jgi:hypothetical protein
VDKEAAPQSKLRAMSENLGRGEAMSFAEPCATNFAAVHATGITGGQRDENRPKTEAVSAFSRT